MLEIDESSVQVYSCSFKLTLGTAHIPLKNKDCQFYLQWKIKNGHSGLKTEVCTSDSIGLVSFNETLKIHTQILNHLDSQKFLKKYSQITIFLISSKHSKRPKIVGSMLIGLHQILNSKKYQQMKNYRLKLSPLDVDLQFKCTSIECTPSSVLQVNLDSALKSQEKFLVMHGGSLSTIRAPQDIKFLKKRITCEYLDEDDQLSKGDCSIIRSDYDETSDHKDLSRDHELGENSNIQIRVMEPYYQKSTESFDWEYMSRIKALEKEDIEVYIKENKNLKKLLWVAKNQRKIEVQRYEQELHELAHQLALKQAQLLKITENQDSGFLKVGELLDETICTREQCRKIKIENQNLKEQLFLERQINAQMNDNYKRIENRLQIVIDWEQQRKNLENKVKELEQQNQLIKVKYFDLQSKTYLKEEQNKTSTIKLKEAIEELESKLVEKDSRIEIISQKVSKFQEELSQFEQQEVVHKVQYSSSNHKVGSSPAKKKISSPLMHILEEEEGLKRIKEEDVEESLASIEGQKQLTTAAELPEPNKEIELYRMMLKGVQAQLDRLKVLYHEKDNYISKERKNLLSELERLRFEFVYQLSKVTASLNQKLFQIKDLKEENMKLKQNKIGNFQSKLFQLENDISNLQEQKLEYFDKCFRLEQENIALIHLNHEKQQIYQSILKKQENQNSGKDLIIRQFERIINIMFDNKNFYFDLLKKYGFVEQQYSKFILAHQQQKSFITSSQQPSNISQIINRFNYQGNNLSESGRSTPPSRDNQELLLESVARGECQSIEPSHVLKQMFEDFNELRSERQRGISYIQNLAKRETSKTILNLNSLLQKLKRVIIQKCGKDHKLILLQMVKDIEGKIETSEVV